MDLCHHPVVVIQTLEVGMMVGVTVKDGGGQAMQVLKELFVAGQWKLDEEGQQLFLFALEYIQLLM